MGILLLSEQKKYGALANYSTSNKSALKQAAVLNSLGLKNHSMHLMLLDQSLKGVDPHAENLGLEIEARIATECLRNSFYFYREVLRIPKSTGTGSNRWRFDRFNIGLVFFMGMSIPYCCEVIRQAGKSTALYASIIENMNIATENTSFIFATHSRTQRDRGIQSLKDIYECLPPYLQFRGRTYGDKMVNTETFSVNAKHNNLVSFVGQSSEKMAKKMGRGLTAAFGYYDEIPFISNIHHSLEVAATTGAAAREEARLDGSPHGSCMATTAGFLDTEEGKYIHSLFNSSAVLNELMYDAENKEDLELKIAANSKGGAIRVYGSYNHRTLGKSDKWLVRTMQDSFVTDFEAPSSQADYFGIWSSGSSTSAIDPKYLVVVNGSKMTPLYTEVDPTKGYFTNWYIPERDIPRRMANAVMGLDTSEGGGNDDIAIVIRDITTGERIATSTTNSTNIYEYSEWLFDNWFYKYDKLKGIVERKSTGGGVLDFLIMQFLKAGRNPFLVLFNTLVHEADKKMLSTIESWRGSELAEMVNRYGKTFGYSTSGTGTYSRTNLYGTLPQCVKLTGSVVYDSKLIDQMSTLVVKNGRVDHSAKGHDDSVVADLLSFWFLTMGNNLETYGIKPGMILAKAELINTSGKKDLSPEEKFDDDRAKMIQDNLRAKISSFMGLLENSTEDLEKVRLELHIGGLERMLIYRETDQDLYSLAAFKEKLDKKNRKDGALNMGSRGMHLSDVAEFNASSGYAEPELGIGIGLD